MTTKEIIKDLETFEPNPSLFFKVAIQTAINTVKLIDKGEKTPQEIINKINKVENDFKKEGKIQSSSYEFVFGRLKNNLLKLV